MAKRKRKHTVAVVVSCIHLPYMVQPAWRLLLKAIDIIKPDVFILNGDGCDFAGICPMNKDRRTELQFIENELNPTRKYIGELEAAIPSKCGMVWLEGNHEHWWSGYHRNTATTTLAPTWYQALTLGPRWEVREYEEEEMPSIELGDLTVTHGTKVRAHSGWTARAELLDRWTPVLIGHTHRLGAFYFTPAETGVIYDAYEIGCLADQTTARKYCKKKPNWQLGFAVVSFDKSGWFDVSLKKISRLRDKPLYRLGLHEGIFTES